METNELQQLLAAQETLIAKIAQGGSLPDCLTAICEQIEEILRSERIRSSILLLRDGCLWSGAAPSLPDEYNQLLNGLEIGECVGSCGTAAYTAEPVIVEDVLNSPLWSHFTSLAVKYDFRSCWSVPITSSSGQILGTFAIYHHQPTTPSEKHFELIRRFSAFASLVIERTLSFEREQALVQTIKSSNERMRAFTDVLPDLCMVIDEHGYYVDVYGEDKEALKAEQSRIVGRQMKDVLPPDDAESMMSVIHRTLQTNEKQIFEYTLDVQKGRRVFEARTNTIKHYCPESPHTRHVLWMIRDITQRKQNLQQIENLAFYDPLTRLPNRRLFFNRLSELVHRVQQSNTMSALLFLDLDDFKRINDSLGHSVGDELLIQVTNRLRHCMRDTDTLARLGGDEFVVLLEDVPGTVTDVSDIAREIANRIIKDFRPSFLLSEDNYRISTSIGIAPIEGDTIDADELLKRADSAMYHAKRQGGEQLAFYEPSLQVAVDRKLQVERDIVIAIEREDICAFFQPQLNRHGQVIGVEALIRWIHPDRGVVPPSEFIPIAERSSLINQLQQIVLESCCRFLQEINRCQRCPDNFRVSINISAIQFNSGQLERNLIDTISSFDVRPEQFILEITESLLMNNVTETVKQMRAIKQHGFLFSIDDFGTGYSSLSYLHTLPVDELKIDRSFVLRLGEEQDAEGIIDAIVSLANNLRFDVIVEGVENESQHAIIIERRIKGVQGFYYARPIPFCSAVDFVTTSWDTKSSTSEPASVAHTATR